MKRLGGLGLVLSFLMVPPAALAAYFPGPPEVLSALKFNSQRAIISDGQAEAPEVHRVHDVFEGTLIAESNPSADRNWAEPAGVESPSAGPADAQPTEVDPFSDAALEEGDDPFADDAGTGAGFDEDPFAEDPFAEEETKIAPMPDPFKRWFNRPVYVFNDHFYEYFMRPVAQTYKDVVAEGFRIMIRNLFYTITFPGRFVSSLFQFKLEKATRVIGRVLINCTMGFLCMVDVANEAFDMHPVEEDFGQVLGYYGLPSGPYLVLPLLGPSSVRDGFGRAVDALMNPLFWVVPDFVTGASITSGQMVNETSFFIEDVKALKESAIDPYESFRDFYNQRREILIGE